MTGASVHPGGGVIGGFLVVLGVALYRYPFGITGPQILTITSIALLLALLVGLKPVESKMLWGFVALAAFSVAWSATPQAALGQVAALATTLAIAGVIARQVPFRRFVRLTDRTIITIAAISIALGQLAPTIGRTQRIANFGALQGIYDHRNALGLMVIFGVITLLARVALERPPLLLITLKAVTYLVALVLTGSSAALGITAVSAPLFVIAWHLRRETTRNRALLTAFYIGSGTVLALIAFQFLPQMLGLLGRDLTFTNRVFIWQGAIEAWSQRPWFGYGWGSILGETDIAGRTINSFAGYEVRSTHSGYLSTALQLGWLGLIYSVVVLLTLARQAFILTVRVPSPVAIWCLLILVALILGDIVETRAFANVGWFFLCLVAGYLATEQAGERMSVIAAQGRGRSESAIARRARLRREAANR